MEKNVGKPVLKGQTDPESSEKKVVEMSKEPNQTASAGLEAIQDILFGEQLRSSNEQLSELQKNSEKTLLNLSNSVDQRFNELTVSLNDKFDTLVKQLADQKTAQKATDNKINSDLVDCKTALTLSIDSTRKELNEKLDRMANEMEGKKLDRDKLSDIFSQFAEELTTRSGKSASP